MRVLTHEEVAGLKDKYPLFFQSGYATYHQHKGSRYYLISSDSGIIMPLKVQKKYSFKIGQYMYRPMQDGRAVNPDIEEAFLKEFIAFCRTMRLCDFILPPTHHFTNFGVVPANSRYVKLGVIVVDLTRDIDDIFKAFSANYRNEMRKAEAMGVKVFMDNSRFNELYNLYKEVHARQSIYYDSAEELKLMLNCIGEEHYIIALSSLNNEITGAALILKSGYEAIYYHSGSVGKAELPGANKLLQFEVMKRLKQGGGEKYFMGGYRYGDVKGTKYEGLQNFKMRFGAQVEEGYHFFSMVGVKFHLYQALMAVYLKLKGVKQNTKGMQYQKKK